MIGLSLSGLRLSSGLGVWQRGLAIVAALAALSDWLFFRRTVGISAAIFVIALAVGVALANPEKMTRRHSRLAVGFLPAFLLPLVVEPGVLAFLFAAFGVAGFAALITRSPETAWHRVGLNAAMLLVDASWRAAADLFRFANMASQKPHAALGLGWLTAWIVPLALGGTFVWLFSAANPLIDGWLATIDLKALLDHINGWRVMFWLAIVSLVWPFVFMRRRKPRQAKAETEHAAAQIDVRAIPVPGQLFGKAAILRSLVLFNALFAVQTVLDIAYLWGGVALPQGLTHASYAHRGAYPLIVTALLAAAFVIAATRPGTEAERSPLIRGLVFLWIAQNVLLVVSSILRLELYVEVYSLTYLRVAAFIWMLIVAVGLILIVARILLGRSNAWLIAANGASLAITLYVCSFINFAGFVADHNVTHSREMSGQGVQLDTGYLLSLGPQAVPAADRFLAARPHNVPDCYVARRNALAARHLAAQQDWRAWSYRGWRLEHYLRNAPPAPGSRPIAPPS